MFPAELGKQLVEVSAFYPKPGGAPANVAVAAARLGCKSAFIGKVGDDAFGHYLIRLLEHEGVTTRGMRLDSDARTTMAIIAMPDEHSAEIMFYRNPGADMLLRPEELDHELLMSARAFHFGSISLIEEPSRSATMNALQIARTAGALISFDVNYRPSLWHGSEEARMRVTELMPYVDVLKVNEEEFAFLTGSKKLETGCEQLRKQGPTLCVVTLGAEGSFFQTSQDQGQVPAFAVNTVDAIGCGDAFVAGLLCQLLSRDVWLKNLDPVRMKEILRYSNAVGALTAEKRGVIPALPTAEQLFTFFESEGGECE